MDVAPRTPSPALILANQTTPRAVLRGAQARQTPKPWAVQIRNLPSEKDALDISQLQTPKRPVQKYTQPERKPNVGLSRPKL